MARSSDRTAPRTRCGDYVPDLALGSEPRYPAGSKKRGMARAIEIVEWAARYAEAMAAECENGQRAIAASVFREQAAHSRFIVKLLRNE